MTVVTTGYMVKLALDVANELEGKIDVEVIDPRTLEPLDINALIASVKKTGRAVVVDEDTKRCGIGAEIGMQIVERVLDSLDTPVQRVGAANYAIPAAAMERCVFPQAADIVAAVKTVAGKK